MTHDPIQQAYDSGRYARQAGRGRETGPMYGIHPEAQKQRDSWRRGWDDENHAHVMGKR